MTTAIKLYSLHIVIFQILCYYIRCVDMVWLTNAGRIRVRLL